MSAGGDVSVDVAVSIVSHDCRALLERCLATLPAACEGVSWNVTVVDNASVDGTVAMLSNRYPWVRLVESKARRGFGANHNRVLGPIVAAQSSRYVLVLNPDTELAAGSVADLVRRCDGDPCVGAAGPEIVGLDGSVEPSSFRFPTVVGECVAAALLPGPLARALGNRFVFHTPCAGGIVDWVVGAALLLRVEALAKAGLFDEGFFLYSEEVDIARRLRNCGFVSALYPSARVQHLGGGSTRGVLDEVYGRSRWTYLRKHCGRREHAALFVLLPLVYLWNILYVLLRVAAAPRSARAKFAFWQRRWSVRIRGPLHGGRRA